MTVTADYTEKICLIPFPNGICGDRFTAPTPASPEPGYAS